MVECKTTDVRGVRIGYREAGSGPPIVLLHGVGESSFGWLGTMAHLAPRHRVVAPDLPGSGASGPSPSGYHSAVLAEVIGEFLEAVEVERAVLIGNSFGGIVALRLALKRPGQVAGLVLVDSAGLGIEITPAALLVLVPWAADAALALAMHPVGAAQRAWLRPSLYFADGQRAPLEWLRDQAHLGRSPEFLRAIIDSLRAGLAPFGQSDLMVDRLHEIHQPTLVVWGEQDRVVPVAHAHRAARRLSHGRCRTIPDCGHMPHLEQPQEFRRLVDEFLADVRLAPQPGASTADLAAARA
jgi:pimeloyl-ACP methyl ester carboxylesterase